MNERRGGARPYTGANQATVRRNNRAVIYAAIWETGPVSRAELATRSGLHAATVTHIVDELLAEGLVKETGIAESATVGRPPVYLEIEPGAAYVVGVNLARNGVRAMLCDLRGRPVEQCSFGGQHSSVEGEVALARLHAAVDMLLGVAQSAGYRVAGIGFGVPGPVDPLTGQVYRSPNWHMWDGGGSYPMGQMLAERFHLPIFVDNNANGSALAERYFGVGRTFRNFLYISCGFGVGGGVIMDGELFRGFYGGAGEVGHVTVNPAGPACACGNIGCLEVYTRVPAVLRRVAEALGVSPDEIDVERASALYHMDHPQVVPVIEEVAGYFTTATVNAVNTLAPEAVVIGGMLGPLAPIIAARVQAEVRHRVFSVLSEHIRVMGSGLPDAPLLGAATLVLREVVRSGSIVLV